MGDSVAQQFASDVAHLQQKGVKAIVVHDGGPQIDAELSRQGITLRFSNGLRITDASTMSVVNSVLKNDINKSKVESIEEAGGRTVGLCAHHRNMSLRPGCAVPMLLIMALLRFLIRSESISEKFRR